MAKTDPFPEGGTFHDSIRLVTDRDIARARNVVMRAMQAHGSSALRRTRFVTAVSEIARNAVDHAEGGEMRVYLHDAPPAISVVCRDRGPGIPDVELALRDGFTTKKGMGHGLGGAKRLSDAFDIQAPPEGGTIVRLASRL